MLSARVKVAWGATSMRHGPRLGLTPQGQDPVGVGVGHLVLGVASGSAIACHQGLGRERG